MSLTGLLGSLPDGQVLAYPESNMSEVSGIIDEIYLRQIYEKYAIVSEGMYVIDVGAHIGVFSLKTAKQVGLFGKVLAIEANPQAIPYLALNVSQNNHKNIIIVPYGIADVEGTAQLNVNLPAFGRTSFLKSTDYAVDVPLRRLDNILNTLNFYPIDFLKIDIEGMELEALKGLGIHLQNIGYIAVAAYHYRDEAKSISNLLTENQFNTIIDNEFIYAWRNPNG